MQTPEEYAEDYPAEPDKQLAARLVDLRDKLNVDLRDVSDEDEARSLTIEHFAEVIRAWMDGK